MNGLARQSTGLSAELSNHGVKLPLFILDLGQTQSQSGHNALELRIYHGISLHLAKKAMDGAGLTTEDQGWG